MGKNSPKIIVLDLRPLQTSYKNRGIGRFSYELVTGLIKNPGKYHSLIFEGQSNPFPEIPVLIQAPCWKRQWLWDQFILPILLWVKGVSLFHCLVGLGPLDSISFPSLFARSCVVTIHDLHMFNNSANPINKFYLGTKRIQLQKKFLPKVAHCMTDSIKTKNDVIHFTGINQNKITTIYLGTDHLLQNSQNSNGAGSIQMEKAFVLSMGDTENKNNKLAYKIMVELKKTYPELSWVLLGDYQKIKDQLEPENPLPHWVNILSNISDFKLRQFYKSADLLLYPTLEEGFGFPLVEAVKHELPVISSNILPVTELIGINFNLSPNPSSENEFKNWVKACSRVMSEPQFRENMIQTNLEHLKEFTWENTTKGVEHIYDLCLNSKKMA